MMFTILIIICLVIALIASISAWVNTHNIIKDLGEIKTKLGITESKDNQSFFNNDLDND